MALQIGICKHLSSHHYSPPHVSYQVLAQRSEYYGTQLVFPKLQDGLSSPVDNNYAPGFYYMPKTYSMYSTTPPSGPTRVPLSDQSHEDVWYQGVSPQRSNSQEDELSPNQRWESPDASRNRRKSEEAADIYGIGSRLVSSPSPSRIGMDEYEISNGAVKAQLYRSPAKPDFRETVIFRTLWILAPITLLITAAVPALCLPVTYLFSGSALAGLLALLGLDGFFNIGATAYLLMSSTIAENWANKKFPRGISQSQEAKRDPSKPGFYQKFMDVVPPSYRIWSWVVNVSGLMVPIFGLIAAYAHGNILTRSDVLPVLAMIAPYLFILFIQTVSESLVRMWEAPIWPILPIVYQAYRLVQLGRGVDLGIALSAPDWLTLGVKLLAGWWVMVLAMQTMWLVCFIALFSKKYA